MIKYLLGIMTIAALVLSCGGEDDANANGEDGFYSTEVPEADVLRVGIKQLEDSLTKISQDNGTDKKVTNLVQQACIEKLKLMYRSYPKDKDAALSLHKVSMMYSAMGVPDLSVKYADSLIENYPKYEQRWLVLQSNAMYYDMEVQPRDKEKMRYYLEKLINEYPNLDPEILDQSKSRLETIDLTFEELIKQQNQPS
ncbi:MAG: tetratricopeptide repeat protein [Crocinitomicaceae bacterium]|nr:tetratricopeptide repeat protein [Crocinitomicaceae bacterium]